MDDVGLADGSRAYCLLRPALYEPCPYWYPRPWWFECYLVLEEPPTC